MSDGPSAAAAGAGAAQQQHQEQPPPPPPPEQRESFSARAQRLHFYPYEILQFVRVAGKPVVFVGRHSAIFGEPKAPALLEQYTDLYVAAATAFCGGGQPRFIWDLGIIYVTSGASEGTVTDLVNRVPEGSIAIYATVGRITRRGASELRRFLELATQRRILVGVAHLGPPALRLRGINTDTKRVQTIFWLNWEQVPGLVTCAEEELMLGSAAILNEAYKESDAAATYYTMLSNHSNMVNAREADTSEPAPEGKPDDEALEFARDAMSLFLLNPPNGRPRLPVVILTRTSLYVPIGGQVVQRKDVQRVLEGMVDDEHVRHVSLDNTSVNVVTVFDLPDVSFEPSEPVIVSEHTRLARTDGLLASIDRRGLVVVTVRGIASDGIARAILSAIDDRHLSGARATLGPTLADYLAHDPTANDQYTEWVRRSARRFLQTGVAECLLVSPSHADAAVASAVDAFCAGEAAARSDPLNFAIAARMAEDEPAAHVRRAGELKNKVLPDLQDAHADIAAVVEDRLAALDQHLIAAAAQRDVEAEIEQLLYGDD